MNLELYLSLSIGDNEKKDLYLFLEQSTKDENKYSFIIKKTSYMVCYCEDGIYDVVNDKMYLHDIYKRALPNQLKITTEKTKKNQPIMCSFNINITQGSSKRYNNSFHIRYNNIIERRVNYKIMTQSNSKTYCNIIFDENAKLIDCYFKLEIPLCTLENGDVNTNDIEKYVFSCFNRTEESKIYNDDFYSLFSIIGNML